MRRFFLAALLISLPLTARACLNDRDSDLLVVQNKTLPDAVRVISGRFERNPPRFYQMRIARVEGELKTNARNFGLYDDLAVAHDKLGDDVSAMRVMAQKRALLPPFNPTDKANKEAWYRYFANDGTFHAHHFLKNGAQIQNIAELQQGRDEIARAIQIKPNAHFGREPVQLLVMDWIIAEKQNKTSQSLGEWIASHNNWRVILADKSGETYYWDDTSYIEVKGVKRDSPEQVAAKEQRRRQTAEGLTGLVVLGAAWDSPDVFEALSNALNVKETVALNYLALLRCHELLQSGAHSFSGLSANQIDPARGAVPENTSEVELYRTGTGINQTNQDTLNQL